MAIDVTCTIAADESEHHHASGCALVVCGNTNLMQWWCVISHSGHFVCYSLVMVMVVYILFIHYEPCTTVRLQFNLADFFSFVCTLLCFLGTRA